ncbi:hypothetical protein L3X38_017258 [Prunus dulcis]|uniref:Uncharacterized protein n=1 Tax=Prunus dulcis TaxID=3755 RepID=A0AAD4Z904_PRUDU|nr:hypothetical protein L3X38_017258 [Prunus dulcis]
MLEKNPKQWHEKLSETLWAYRTSRREATGMTPYALTYGHDAILPMEIAVQSLRIAYQHGLTGEDYSQAMLLELEELDAKFQKHKAAASRFSSLLIDCLDKRMAS